MSRRELSSIHSDLRRDFCALCLFGHHAPAIDRHPSNERLLRRTNSVF
jgi:hypothetical protein